MTSTDSLGEELASIGADIPVTLYTEEQAQANYRKWYYSRGLDKVLGPLEDS